MTCLGKLGRLGNQLFQYAFLFALSKEKGYKFSLPPNGHYYKNIEKYASSNSIFDCFDLVEPILQTKKKLPIFREKYFHYDQSFPLRYPDNVDYYGYFQSAKYFNKYKTELLSHLKFKQEHILKCDNTLDYENIVSLHVRRGDYVGNLHHPTITTPYIHEAKSQFPNKKFLVFSDDINWCKSQNIGDYYSQNSSDCVDLYQMTLCSGSIVANSSFSWWGAYLGRQKEKVIAPKHWFNDTKYFIHKKNTSDIYCQDWIVI